MGSFEYIYNFDRLLCGVLSHSNYFIQLRGTDMPGAYEANHVDNITIHNQIFYEQIISQLTHTAFKKPITLHIYVSMSW